MYYYCVFCRLAYVRLDGSVPLSERAAMIDEFNEPDSRPTVFLASTQVYFGLFWLVLVSFGLFCIFQCLCENII